MAGEAILIVDDNPSNVRLLEFMLKRRGYHVLIAVDATAALATVEQTVPQLVLMDVQLPGMDGLALTRRLKADSRFATVPIIAVTASAMKGDEQKAREAGCDGYVTKPIDIQALAELVASCLARA